MMNSHQSDLGRLPYESYVAKLLAIGQGAIAHSLWKIRRDVTSGVAGRVVEVSTGKIVEDDPTKLVDRGTERVILKYLEHKLRFDLGLQYIVSTEEEGTIKVLAFRESASPIDLVVFIDPVDFTESVVRGLDGSSLITFYSISRAKILAAVVGDVREEKIYFASEHQDGAYSQYIEYSTRPENATEPYLNDDPEFSNDDEKFRISGHFRQLRPSRVDKLSEAHLNCLLNKPERMGALFKRKKLINAMENNGRFYIVGGSLGLVRVAAGILDGAIEFAKGFREWDSWPGIYICKKAGAFVSDLKGNEITCSLSVTPDRLKQRLENPERQPFIVAGSEVLGKTLVKMQLDRE